MITVRFPTGFSVQYNAATFVSGPDGDGVVRLYRTSADVAAKRCPIARVPKECIVEFTAPCRTYSAAGPSEDMVQEVKALRKQVASLARKLGKQ